MEGVKSRKVLSSSYYYHNDWDNCLYSMIKSEDIIHDLQLKVHCDFIIKPVKGWTHLKNGHLQSVDTCKGWTPAKGEHLQMVDTCKEWTPTKSGHWDCVGWKNLLIPLIDLIVKPVMSEHM